jgi:hypothetical protein
MARVAGVRSNPTIRAFDLRLRGNGKHAKPALTACMRKFLVILNAMPHKNTHWQTPALTSPFLPSGGRCLNTVAARGVHPPDLMASLMQKGAEFLNQCKGKDSHFQKRRRNRWAIN